MQNKPDNQVNAGFFVRLAAYLIDYLIVGAALLLIRIPVAISSWFNPDNILVRDFIFQYSIVDILYYLLTAAYFVFLTYYTGATVGKKMLHLRVISVEGRKLTFFEVAFRETVGRFLSGLVINVGYFMIGIQKEKHGLHDMLSDTEVIYYHEKKVEVETPVVKQEAAGTVYSPNGYMVPTYIQESYSSPKEEGTQQKYESDMIPKKVEYQEELVAEEVVAAETVLEETILEEIVSEETVSEEIQKENPTGDEPDDILIVEYAYEEDTAEDKKE